MRYIPVKIVDFDKGNKFVICDAIVNAKIYREFRDVSRVEIEMMYLPRKTFDRKFIYKDHKYVLISDEDGSISYCNKKKIIEWGEYIFKKYEKKIDDDFKSVKKKRKRKKI